MPGSPSSNDPNQPKILDEVRKYLRLHHYSIHTERSYVFLPHALARIYPHAGKDWGWQYVFPARDFSTDPRGGAIRRHYVDPSVINKAIKAAVRRVGLAKRISAHTFRHSLTCGLVLVPRERASPGGDEPAGWNRDGRGRMTVLNIRDGYSYIDILIPISSNPYLSTKVSRSSSS